VNTCELRFPGFDAGSERGAIRWKLFVHRDVRDVLLTPRRDTLRVVHRGSASPAAWLATLREAGFPQAVFNPGDGSKSSGSRDAAA
jgi:hypothetical protein